MTLRIIAAEEQLRVLKLSVQTLSKFGAEIVFEARPNGIHLRSVNQSKSAYVRITFNSSFFDVYELFEQPVLSAGILAKCLVASLRTQRICRAIFEVFTQENRLVVYVDCENGLQKKFQFDLIDSEALQAEINFDMYPVRITVEAGEMNRLLASFQQSLDEVTLIAIPDSGANNGNGNAGTDKSCQIHSFYDPSKVDLDNSLLHTQLSLNAHQHFLEYQHTGRETVDVTFNLKDFKSVLAYCLSTRNNLGILFSTAGEPLAILPMPVHEHMNSEFTAEFVLATMLDSTVDRNTGKPSPMFFQPNRAAPAPAPATATAAPASAINGRGVPPTSNQHTTLAKELERRNKACAHNYNHNNNNLASRSRSSDERASDMDTNEVAKHLVAMNHHTHHQQQQEQPMTTSTATTGSVRARGLDQQERENPQHQTRMDHVSYDGSNRHGNHGHLMSDQNAANERREEGEGGVRKRGSSHHQQKKLRRTSQETESTLSLRYSAVEEVETREDHEQAAALQLKAKDRQEEESNDDEDDEVPGTPTHERRVDTWIENWS